MTTYEKKLTGSASQDKQEAVKRMVSSARLADSAVTQNVRDLVKDILRKELDNRDFRDGKAYEDMADAILAFGTLSDNKSLKGLGRDSAKKVIQRNKKTKEISQSLDSAAAKIDSLSYQRLLAVLEKLNKWGLETSIDYILASKRLIRKDFL